MRTLVILASFFLLAASYPPFVSLPPYKLAGNAVEVENYGQVEFSLRDKREVRRGKVWTGRLAYADTAGDDPRKALVAVIDAMARDGWEVVMRDEPGNTPVATLKREKDGKEAWAAVEVSDSAKITVLEVCPPPTKIALAPPAGTINAVPEQADFPFLMRFPGAKLTQTRKFDVPILVALEAGRPGVPVTAGQVVKTYEVPAGTGRLEVIVAYREALKAAGWTIVHEDTDVDTEEPSISARYPRAPSDLWLVVRAAPDYAVHVGDAARPR